MAELNLGKVVGSDAKINGQTAITLTGANGVSVITSGTDVIVDGAGIKTELTTHTSNTDIHVTADEKAAWNAVNYSNPNLLINPDFAINQRGETEYTTTGYTVDRWSMQVGFKITPLENGIRICPTGAVTSNLFAIIQNIPVSKAMFGNDYTLTVNVSETNDYAYAVVYAYNSANAVIKSSDKIKLHTGLNSTTIRNIPDNTAYIRVQFTINSGAQTSDTLEILWAKLELGGIATPYTPPDPATELAKCQRYTLKIVNGVQAVAYRILPNSISFYFPTPATLRVNATSTADFVVQTGNDTEHSGFTFEFYAKPNGVIVEAKKTAHGITLSDSPILVCKTQGIFDAEL